MLDGFFDDVARGGTLDRAMPSGVAITFELRGEGGGTWTVQREAGRIVVARVAHLRPDCRLRCTVEDFCALLEGRLSPMEGFADGRLDLEGDVGLVLRLQRAVGKLSA